MSRQTTGAAVACFLGFLLVGALTSSGVAAQQRVELSASAQDQIRALLEEKASRTPAQHKMSSQLLYGMKIQRGDALTQAVPALRSSIAVGRDGTTLVDIDAEVTDSLLGRIAAVGGRVVNSFPQYRAVRAHVPLSRLESLAGWSEVRFVRPADQAITNVINRSEGDVAHRADVARANFGADGSGVKICALSDGVDALALVQSSGDLPAVEILSGQSGSGTEGSAMLEIIHDLARAATLGFATALGGQAQFAQNILDLRNILGCDVIVDDIFYFAEPAFQDGIIAQAVDQVVADGAVFFSSAGNSGNLNDGTSGVWEGDYADSGVNFTGGGTTGRLHDFGGGATTNQLTANAPFAVTLHWSDPIGGSSNDYDLCVLNSTATLVLTCSTNIQTGTQDPFEIVGAVSAFNRLAVINFANGATPRFLHLNTVRGRLAIATDGQTAGHSAAVGAFGVAAVDVATASGGAFTGGPANPVETFSSDGPRRIFYEANGTPITPGNFSSTGGTLRQKPDIAAADGVSTATPGFATFFGTSAAAPHAAAIAGLMLSYNSCQDLDFAQLFADNALDIEAPGPDRDSGVGLLDAAALLGALSDPFLVVNRSFDSAWTTVPLNAGFQDPVVVAGPLSFANRQPAVVALRRIGAASLQIRAQEWRYLNGKHPDEQAALFAMDPGRRVLPDGSIWEVGTLSARGNGKWQRKRFMSAFPGTPELFLTIQNAKKRAPATVRARRVNRRGFQAALFEEEKDFRTGHPRQTVGYLAVFKSGRSGMLANGTPYSLARPNVNHRFKTVLGESIKLEEEKSKDREIRHRREKVSALRLGSCLFAQQVTDRERDTTAIRQRVSP